MQAAPRLCNRTDQHTLGRCSAHKSPERRHHRSADRRPLQGDRVTVQPKPSYSPADRSSRLRKAEPFKPVLFVPQNIGPALPGGTTPRQHQAADKHELRGSRVGGHTTSMPLSGCPPLTSGASSSTSQVTRAAFSSTCARWTT